MRDYHFWFIQGTSRPEGHISAQTHDEFYAKLGPWLKERGAVIDPKKEVHWQESGIIPPVPSETASHEPLWSVVETPDGGQFMTRDPNDVRGRFFAHKQAHPGPEKLTPLAERMQSGGA